MDGTVGAGDRDLTVTRVSGNEERSEARCSDRLRVDECEDLTRARTNGDGLSVQRRERCGSGRTRAETHPVDDRGVRVSVPRRAAHVQHGDARLFADGRGEPGRGQVDERDDGVDLERNRARCGCRGSRCQEAGDREGRKDGGADTSDSVVVRSYGSTLVTRPATRRRFASQAVAGTSSASRASTRCPDVVADSDGPPRAAGPQGQSSSQSSYPSCRERSGRHHRSPW